MPNPHGIWNTLQSDQQPQQYLIDHLTHIWAQVLEHPDCPTQATFMDLGGDSISATQIVSRVRDATGIEVPLDTMFDDMTIERMAAWLVTQPTARSGTALPPVQRQDRSAPLPLSHSQRRMWLVQSFAPETSGYNVYFALRLEGSLDLARLQLAVNSVWARHNTFRTRIVMTGDGPHQIIDPLGTPHSTITPVDLCQQGTRVEREAQAQAFLKQLISTPFDLSASSPWRIALVQIEGNEYILTWVAHHILVDLWANLTIARELALAYARQPDGALPPEQGPLLGCADLGVWQQGQAVQKQLAPQLAYWQTQLCDLTPSNLPTDYELNQDWNKSAKRVVAAIPGHALHQLKEHAARYGHTPYMVMLACLSLMLNRQSRQEDIAVITPVANRQHPQTENIVGSLTNTLVMRIKVRHDMGILELLDQVKQTTLKAMANQDLPFDQLVEQIEQTRRQFDLPLGLQVMLNVGNAPADGIAFEGLKTQRILLDRGGAQYPLAITVDLDLTRTVLLEYADRVWTPESANAFVTHFIQLLERALQDPTQPISALHWLSPQSQTTLATWNDTQQAVTPHTSIDALLRAQCTQTPHALACTFQGQQLSYIDLQQQAEALASHLQEHGIGQGHRVGIHLPRGTTQLIALRAVLMTGAAYVPLDLRIPDERLRDMVQDAELTLLISENWQAPAYWPKPPICLNPKDVQLTDSKQPFKAVTPPGPNDPAYVIYTSGSTGRPKGVVVPHRTVLNFLHSMAREPGLSAQDKLLAVTTLSFDIAVLELLLPLSVGAQIILASDDEAMDGHVLRRLIEQHHATVMQATPATWRALLDAGWGGRSDFKALIGGEALSLDMAKRLRPLCGELWNMYGPTETTVWSTCWRVQDPEQGIYIGRPIANTRISVVDQFGHDCPIGVPGEIVIEGGGVANGYWHRDDLTAERFVAPSAYKTGDLGRWLWNGQLEHLGRLDHQVKVRGYRIEPGDIEAPLLRHPDVAHCVVIAREDTPGDVRLVAYLVRRDDTAPPISTGLWREYLRQTLPDYMVPQHFIVLPAMPLLANGKLNRHALPAPQGQTTTSPAHRPPSTALTPWEARLATVWRQLLNLSQVSPQDNFFDLGGHSLLAMQAINQIAEDTQVRVSPRRYIFETLAQLAASYERAELTPEDATDQAANSSKPSLFNRLLSKLK